ncbi:hypothetical protein C8R47DRAFT_659824 [Mycena vitilis]|nr:hypothetical protein C8R47DRAFT_659824 [Mycena vitilis]
MPGCCETYSGTFLLRLPTPSSCSVLLPRRYPSPVTPRPLRHLSPWIFLTTIPLADRYRLVETHFMYGNIRTRRRPSLALLSPAARVSGICGKRVLNEHAASASDPPVHRRVQTHQAHLTASQTALSRPPPNVDPATMQRRLPLSVFNVVSHPGFNTQGSVECCAWTSVRRKLGILQTSDCRLENQVCCSLWNAALGLLCAERWGSYRRRIVGSKIKYVAPKYSSS